MRSLFRRSDETFMLDLRGNDDGAWVTDTEHLDHHVVRFGAAADPDNLVQFFGSTELISEDSLKLGRLRLPIFGDWVYTTRISTLRDAINEGSNRWEGRDRCVVVEVTVIFHTHRKIDANIIAYKKLCIHTHVAHVAVD